MGYELSAENGRALYLPPGVAHGFQTLDDDCEVHYLMGHEFVSEAERGVRWDDPAFSIRWPRPSGERTISARDRAYPILPTMSRVLITGGSGFVGRHVVAALASEGHDVHVVSRRARPAQEGVVSHRVDLLSPTRIVSILEPEVLVHLAWYAEHGRFWSSTENVRWVEASLALLRRFVAAGGRRAVMSGTCAEYRWSSRAVYPEMALCAPATLYGTCKHAVHQIAAGMTADAGVSLAWARLFFLYGPHEAPARFVPTLVRSLLVGEPAAMTAGTQRRDFMHVSDAGAAIAALANSELAGPVNIASGEGVSLRRLGAVIAAHIGRRDLLRVGALPARESEPRSLVADTRRLRHELGFQPRFGLDEGVEDTVAWWRRQLADSAPVGDRA